MFTKVFSVIRSPVSGGVRYLAHHYPVYLVKRYSRLAQRQGLNALYLILSFDCDTDEDAEVAWEVQQRLNDMSVYPVYAVCGDLLRRGASVYQKIAASGSEFINHGDTQHTEIDPQTGLYRSCFFYDKLPRETVRNDIVAGDRAVREVIGKAPAGFRAPHFGTFQRADELRFQHQLGEELGYRYCTTTLPDWGLRRGPLFKDLGLYEFPVSGRGSALDVILDSWCCFQAPDRSLGPDDYLREATHALSLYAYGGAGILNYYVDPCHVAGQPRFFEAVAEWVKLARPCGYSELLDEIEGHR